MASSCWARASKSLQTCQLRQVLAGGGRQRGARAEPAAAGSGQQTMLVEFPVKIPLTDAEDSGRVSTMAIAGFERQPNMFPLRLFQSRQRSTVR